MSIYSGFATRQQQETYDETICSFLYMMSKRIIKFFKGEPANDPKFIDILIKSYNQIKTMQDSKYLEPKISNSAQQLIAYLKIKRIEYQQVKQDGKPQPIVQNKIYTKIKQQKMEETQKKYAKTINQKTQKLIVTQRLANNYEGQGEKGQKNNFKARGISSSNHYRSTDIVITNKILRKQKKLNDPIFYHTPKAQQYKNRKQSRTKLGREQQTSKIHSQSCYDDLKQSKEDVRQLIKGYLSRRKKNVIKQSQISRQEIQDVFKET